MATTDVRPSFPLKRSTLAAAVARRLDTNGDDRRSSFPLKRSTLAAALAVTTIRHQWRRQTFVIPSQTVDARSRTGCHDDSTSMATTDVRHSLSNGRRSQPQWHDDSTSMATRWSCAAICHQRRQGPHKRDDVDASLQTKIFSLGYTGWSDRLR